MEKNNLFMAFGKGVETKDSVSQIKRYIGVAPCKVIAVNPSLKELNDIYGSEIENEPQYISEREGVKQVRIDFILQTDEEKCGVELKTKLSFFMSNAAMYNKDQTKVKVIDEYGRTAWVTVEECKEHKIPQYANGPANITANYRPMFRGEELLTEFIKTYLGIPSVMSYIDGKWVNNPKLQNLADAEARLEHIKDYFTGKIDEVKTAIACQPNNKVKVLFGVKTNNEGKQYQTAFNDLVLKANVSSYDKLKKVLAERKEQGAYADTEFAVIDIVEYEVKPSSFETPASNSDPFGTTNDNPFDF